MSDLTNTVMSVLFSDAYDVSDKVTNRTAEIEQINLVGEGTTNHDTNSICVALYNETRTLTQEYCVIGAKDSKKIEDVARILEKCDLNMANEVLNK